MSIGDEELVARARDGDRAAFEELVRRHADRLHAVVLRMAGSSHEAEEVTQEAFLRAWRGIRSFKGDAQFFTWLYRIGVNEARRRAQRRPAGGMVASLEDHRFEPRDPGPGPARTAEHRDLRSALEDAVGALDPEYRAPLVLRDIEGLSTAEAAEIMGLGEAAFKSRLHRARLAVRAAVRDYLPGDET
jgi:RNA polymerase sigma-70 factor (ECF subfamily)